MEKAEKKAADYLLSYDMDYTRLDMDACSEDYIREMELGLSKKGAGSLEMIPTFLKADGQLPLNTKVPAVDAGGTNLRIGVVHFNKSGMAILENHTRFPMPGASEQLSAEGFFSTIAGYIENLAGINRNIGFCFSYPIDMMKNHDGKLIRFTKEIKAKAVEGLLIGENLKAAMKERGVKGDNQMVLLNDTVATLLAGKSIVKERRFDSYIGFILGTGMNCSYIEENEKILKEPGLKEGLSQIINIESGNYALAPRGGIDKLYDTQTDYPGQSTYEKMISGGYLGQLILTVLKKAAEDGLLSRDFQGRIEEVPDLETRDVDQFLNSPAGAGVIAGCIPGDGEFDREIIRYLLARLIRRAGKFAAVTLSSIIRKTGKGRSPGSPVCITADGSTFYRLKNLRETIVHYMDEYLVQKHKQFYEFVHVENAPLIGAAIAGLLN